MEINVRNNGDAIEFSFNEDIDFRNNILSWLKVNGAKEFSYIW